MSDEINRPAQPGDLFREIHRDAVANAAWHCFLAGEFASYEQFLTHLAVVLIRRNRETDRELFRLAQRLPPVPIVVPRESEVIE